MVLVCYDIFDLVSIFNSHDSGARLSGRTLRRKLLTQPTQCPEWRHFHIRPSNRRVFRLQLLRHNSLQHSFRGRSVCCNSRQRLPRHALEAQRTSAHTPLHPANYRLYHFDCRRPCCQKPRSPLVRLLHHLILSRHFASDLLLVSTEHRR